MTQIANLHSRLQVTAMVFLIVVGIWGLITFLRRRPMGPYYGAALWIAQLLLMAEALLGLLLFIRGGSTPRFAMHIIYGVVAVLCLPVAYAYTGGRQGRREGLIYAGTCLFLAAITVRSWETGG